MGNNVEGQNQRRKFNDYFNTGDRIGSGTFATVKRCTRKADKKQFAVKIIDKRHLTGRELVGLKDEIRILKTMNHPHVISMADVFDDGTRVKMVLQLCEGGDLFDQILKSPKHRFSEAKCAEIVCIISQTLEYLHNNYVVHRDLKPENILFTKGGVLKVTDFGLAHYLKFPPNLHVMHTCCGTPHYVAPEVLSNNQYGHQIDFWSLGVILYIMLSGYQPFNSHSIHAMYGMIIRGQYQFPSPHWDGISADAIDLVKNLMCVDIKKRYTNPDVLKHKWILKHVNLDEFQENEKKLFVTELDHLKVKKNNMNNNNNNNKKNKNNDMENDQKMNNNFDSNDSK